MTLTEYYTCEKCGCVDSIFETQITSSFVCSSCSTGEWHGAFERFSIDPTEISTINGSDVDESGFASFDTSVF